MDELLCQLKTFLENLPPEDIYQTFFALKSSSSNA